MPKNRAAIILASGEGKRMKSEIPKVLHRVGDETMVGNVLKSARQCISTRPIVIVGYKSEDVKKALGNECEFVFQAKQLGTGHAVAHAEDILRDFDGTVLVLAGDTPLITPETISKVFSTHESAGAAVTILTAVIEGDRTGLGRIVRGKSGLVERIVEEKDATEAEKAITEVNTGTYCFDSKVLFEALPLVTNNNAQGEYYLTDVIGIAQQGGYKVMAVIADNYEETLGVNTPEQLATVNEIYKKRVAAKA